MVGASFDPRTVHQRLRTPPNLAAAAPAQEPRPAPAARRVLQDFARDGASRPEGVGPRLRDRREGAVRSFLPFFARRGVTSFFGKLDDLGHLRVAKETGERIRQRAAAAGIPVMEYVRGQLEVLEHGREEIVRRQIIRLDSIEVVGRNRDGSEPNGNAK